MSSLAPIPHLSLIIQAGGASSRMGYDKGLAPFLGQTLVQHVLARLAPLASEIIITTNNPGAYAFLNRPLAADRFPGYGALGGLQTAFSAASGEMVAVVACDMPFASPAVFSALYTGLQESGADAAVPRSMGGHEPFHAVYRRLACLALVEAAIRQERRRADAWYAQARLYWMEWENVLRLDPTGLAFRNVNTPQELAAAEELASKRE